MQLRRDDVIAGVDTHKDEHVAVLLDGVGGRLAELTIPATNTGYAQLLALAREHVGPRGRLIAFGVEGTGSYGIGLARFLRRHGQSVREVHRPPRKASGACRARATPSTPNTPPAKSWPARRSRSRRPPTAASNRSA
jgi:transposase